MITPELQLSRATRLWPHIALPGVPAYTPVSKTSFLLLHVPDTLKSLWSKIITPAGYTKFLENDKEWDLHLAPNKHEHKVPIWLEFDPQYGRHRSPASLWGKSNLAASEVLSAVIQYPDWCLTWFKGTPAPNLSGYRIAEDGRWSRTLYLDRVEDSRQLELRSHWADSIDQRWASPSVRVC